MRLPGKPMRRHHYLYVRNRYLTDPAVLKRIAALHRETSCKQARELGLIDPEGPGSFTHPHLSRMLYADGKVITPLFKGRLGQTCTDKATGEIKQVRYEPDADLHFEGDGEPAYGTKFVVVAARSDEARGRMILDVDWVPDKGGEAKAAMGCFERLSPLVPGAQGVISMATFYADGTVLFETPGFSGTNGLPTITCTNTSPVSGITAGS